MTRRWQDNAREYRALSKQGYGVRLALLAACSVGHGVSARGFADLAGTADTTVLQHLKKWDRMVDAGWDVPRSELEPAMADVLELPDGFVAEFEALTEQRPITRHASGPMIADAVRSDPAVAALVAGALLEQPQRLVDAASNEQLAGVTDALLNRSLREVGMRGVQPPRPPGDPRPAWSGQVTRIGTDAHEVVGMIRDYQEQGRGDLAAWCYRELRHTLLEALTELESIQVPDTAEGVNR